MNVIDLTGHKFSSDRKVFRKEIINLFLDEEPGTGTKELATKYRYLVKKVSSHDIYLQRPAQFNNGFDFTLNVSGINFNVGTRNTSRPTHQNIFDDLSSKKTIQSELYEKLKKEIDRVYQCQEPVNYEFNFGIGLDSEILIECIKWLFLEQDVTYWNYSGRAMFYGGINRI